MAETVSLAWLLLGGCKRLLLSPAGVANSSTFDNYNGEPANCWRVVR
jgi:hypothetical protein